ncbi:glutathione S-transferase [Lentisphaera profundi]|uniref:Glutathione S-transferase n=1 Tax=Lentisphaera profundi TaxID=1658616 RepID=A0ABY7W1V5_9BACT|nr:glutathione S-transferase [Lentisphaera profundi]WDE99415.1 glutathione S-transferase [Lentisphaera profundi]
MTYPILYSLQHCPYAMRARMALLMAQEDVLLRAISTKDKPKEMLLVSAKGTVPVLVLENGKFLDESLDIMLWALKKNDPHDLLKASDPSILINILALIDECDVGYRANLSAYKHAKRFHIDTENYLRSECEKYIQKLEALLENQSYFFGESLSLADLAILPFVRQFANADKKLFRDAPYENLSQWLSDFMASALFSKVMRKYPLWNENHEQFLFN